jgi:hypothetical protein
MKKVYKIVATRIYMTEVIAYDEDDAVQIAYQLAYSDWDEGALHIDECELISDNLDDYYGDE